MKTYRDAEGRDYYLKEGEIHYVDDDEPDSSRPRRKGAVVVGVVLILIVIVIGVVKVAGEVSVSSVSAVDPNLFRTQVALEQTQTALAVTPVKEIVPTIAPTVVTTFVPSSTPAPFNGTELLTVAFADINATCTQNYYTGVVNLDIAGSGQAGGKNWSDAFYLFEDEKGTAYNPPQTQQFDLEIDRERAIKTLGLLDNPPAYNSDHHYVVSYNLGKFITPICFRISDYNVGDNTGEFQISVSSM